MENPLREWNQKAPALLWAHEIRRENIHLVDQIDRTRTELASTITTTNNVKQSITDLEEQVQGLDAGACGLERKLDEVKDKLIERVENLSGLVASSQDENAKLRKRLEGFEKEFALSVERRFRLLEDAMRSTMMAEIKTTTRRELGTVRYGEVTDVNTFKDQDADFLVPNSMSTEESISPQEYHLSRKPLAQDTFGEYDEQFVYRSNDGAIHTSKNESEAGIHRVMRQSGRSLAEYLSFAEMTRMQLPPRKREGSIVEAVVRGLDDPKIRGLMERQMDGSEWSWSVLAMLLRGLAKGQESKILSDINSGENAESGGATKIDETTKPRERKKRRFIPIVPADEEDELVLASINEFVG